ncbi:hypothetical protein DPMN_023730 [Dreissena polymorpha]|uniref:Chitobiosyldiphosphodolichol beta-mannosyltransferase n=1 Tax=Dreissena polymorpha TaxID=45954 RepID=A0A9D4RA58_DREPO|nr:hypothetical protein DPMN_023730 [Dreissena polymorpha]
MILVGTILLALPPIICILYIILNYYVPGKKSVCIVVLGDIGRSPRMQYHAISFMKSGFDVDIVGYGGSEVQAELKKNEKVSLHLMLEPPVYFKIFPKIIQYATKVIWQSITLAIALLLMPKCGHIFVQNPPCIPTFMVAIVTSWLRGSRLVVDWHNYGYTIMALSLGNSHPLVKFSHWYERVLGKWASANLCVTKAMKEDLSANWGIRCSVLYDRPPEMFTTAGLNDRHRLFVRLAAEYPVFRPENGEISNDETAFTVANGNGEATNGDAYYLQKRPALLISSTSWTEYESSVEKSSDLPKIVCVITGKGPLKEHYSEVIRSQNWKNVSFCLPWLTPEDYPTLLGSADVGICLHKSSSGLDLPMKVVDMFGCGLPVCAINFNCLDELVHHNKNGLIFNDSSELAHQIMDLLQGFPDKSKKLDTLRKNLTAFQSSRWHDNWIKVALPLFEGQDQQKAE